MVVQAQQVFSILSNHPVSGFMVANVSFSWRQRHPSWPAWPGGAIDRFRIANEFLNSGF